MHRGVQQDLDVHLVVGAVHAGGVVDRVGIDAAAGERVLDAPELCEAEVAAFADYLASQLAAVHPDRIVSPGRRPRRATGAST